MIRLILIILAQFGLTIDPLIAYTNNFRSVRRSGEMKSDVCLTAQPERLAWTQPEPKSTHRVLVVDHLKVFHYGFKTRVASLPRDPSSFAEEIKILWNCFNSSTRGRSDKKTGASKSLCAII